MNKIPEQDLKRFLFPFQPGGMNYKEIWQKKTINNQQNCNSSRNYFCKPCIK